MCVMCDESNVVSLYIIYFIIASLYHCAGILKTDKKIV